MAFHRPRLKLPSTLRALRHRNYNLFITGQIISLTGSWVQDQGSKWLVYNTLVHDSFLLGMVGFAAGIPILALGLFAGAIADSVNRLKLIMLTQTLAMFQALIMGALTLIHGPSGHPLITIWHVILFATFAGIVQAFDLPARQTFLLEMVPKEDLQNAVALNSMTFNAARVLGPSIAGLVIIAFDRMWPERIGFGSGMCFILNGLTFIAVLVQLRRMKFPRGTIKKFKGSSEGYLIEGLRYLRNRRDIMGIMCYVGMMTLFGIPYLMLIVPFAHDVLKGDARTLGALTTCIGVGAMIGGTLLAGRQRIQGLGRIIAVTTFGFSGALIAFAFSNRLLVSCSLAALAGFCMVIAMISSQTLVQTLISESIRGRVLSIYSMINVGLYPFGQLISGAEASFFNVRRAFIINGLVCLCTAIIFVLKLPSLRRAAHETEEYKLAILAGGQART